MVALPKPLRNSRAPVATPSVTWSAFLDLPEDDTRELIDGTLMELEVPTSFHEAIVMFLGGELHAWAKVHGGRVLGSGYKVKINERRGLMPDVQFYRKGRVLPHRGLDTGAPDLAIEVVSPSSGRSDKVFKLESYKRIGCPEYWIVDPSDESILRFLLRDGEWIVANLLDEQTFRPETFPGLEISLDQLFDDPERVSADPEPEATVDAPPDGG